MVLVQAVLVKEIVVPVLLVRADSGRVASPVGAVGALVRPLPRVGTDVAFEVVAGATAVVAVGAAIRPFPSVSPEVQLELVAATAHFATERTRDLGLALHGPHPAQLFQPLATLQRRENTGYEEHLRSQPYPILKATS